MEWVYTLAKALYQLDGRAHSSDIAKKCAELNEQNPQKKMASTVRDALQRYSADSSKGKKRGILRGSHRDVFKSDPALGNSIFEFASLENPIVKFVSGESDGEITRKTLVDGGASISLISALDEEIRMRHSQELASANQTVFVREHWRSLPGERIDVSDFPDDERLFPAAAWCTPSHLEVELKSGARISVPIEWYPRLLAATPVQRRKIQLSPYGLHLEEIDEDISIKSMLFGTRGIGSKVAD